MSEPSELDALVEWIHKWPGGAPNEVWSCVSDISWRLRAGAIPTAPVGEEDDAALCMGLLNDADVWKLPENFKIDSAETVELERKAAARIATLSAQVARLEADLSIEAIRNEMQWAREVATAERGKRIAAEVQVARLEAGLSMTRDQAQLMAGEMTAQEWRTVKAILDAIKRQALTPSSS